jgi:ParB family chromosome partitioning protein
MATKKGLGRGFDTLIPSELLDESFDPTSSQDGKSSDLRSILLTEIHADENQPRKNFDAEAIAELAESIRVHGIVQPLVVTPRRAGGYTIVAGERRFRAAQIAGIEKLPALVRTLSAQHKLELSLIENLQREDLNAIETATAYLKLQEQFNLSPEEIGQRVGGKSASAVQNTMRLLKLPKKVIEGIAAGKMTEGQARPLNGLEPDVAIGFYEKIVAEQWSARRIESVIGAYKRSQKGEVTRQSPAKKALPPAYRQAARNLGTRLSAEVDVTTTTRGAGKLIIAFTSQDDLERIAKLFDS